MEWRRPVERKWPYRHLNYSRRIEVDELSWWERYFGEWLTTRQVAWMLHISMRSVGHLCENGRLDRERFRNEMSGRVQWHFRVEKVRALMGEREYCHRRAVWERYFSVEGKAARAREAAAQFERDAAVCAEAMRKSPWHNERKVW
jgi:hypothetical protein